MFDPQCEGCAKIQGIYPAADLREAAVRRLRQQAEPDREGGRLARQGFQARQARQEARTFFRRWSRRIPRAPMFAERRYCEKMSKNSGFLDISQEHVQDMDMLFEACGISLWRDIEFAPDKAVFWWRDSHYRATLDRVFHLARGRVSGKLVN